MKTRALLTMNELKKKKVYCGSSDNNVENRMLERHHAKGAVFLWNKNIGLKLKITLFSICPQASYMKIQMEVITQNYPTRLPFCALFSPLYPQFNEKIYQVMQMIVFMR